MFPPEKGGALFVEPLEARIAPTILYALAGNPQFSSAPHYITYHSAPTATKLGFVPGSTYGVAGSNVYALKLTAGDFLEIYNSATGFSSSDPFLKDTGGTLIAFFTDANGDGQVQSNELTGLSLSAAGSAEVNGNVNGDIVTNLTNTGTVTLRSAGPSTQSIAGLNIVGNVFGSILSGGSINNVTVSGSVDGVLAGSAVNGTVYHFGDPGVATGTLAAAPPSAHHAGASISNLSLLTVTDVHAGHGGFGATGGSVTDLTLQSDTAPFNIVAGPGGHGSARVAAGAGGNISGITVKGVTDTDANALMRFVAGAGGPDRGGKGGAGGSISDVATSFDTAVSSGTLTLSADQLDGDILLQAGGGGLGLLGGSGGSVSNSFLDGTIPGTGAANPVIQVLAGSGGAEVAARGHGGTGGSISQVTAENLNTGAGQGTAAILFQAGAGGTGAGGGSVNAATLLGAIVTVNGGNGGTGPKIGGAGGSIDTLTIENNTQIFTTNLTLDAGIGGAGNTGAGGAGGNVTTVNVADAELSGLVIDGGNRGNGGAGRGGIGGAGGSVTGLSVDDEGALTLGLVTIRTGNGGNGSLGGGAGGALGTSQSAVELLGDEFSFNASTGAGGNVLAKGHGVGGAGGDANTLGIANESVTGTSVSPTGATGVVTSGAGGMGSTGGRGGDLTSVDLLSSSNVSLNAGVGGGGRLLAAGAGGAVLDSAAVSLFGSVSAVAGNAGVTGADPGAGGIINGFVASALDDVRIVSGSGTFGGAGGEISNSGTAVDQITQDANGGSLTVTAGHGSSAKKAGGAGGSISGFNGSVGQSGVTAFTAGAGGGGTNKRASGAGGSISAVTLTGANGIDNHQAFITFDGGNAGEASQAVSGGIGGGVSNVTISGLRAGTLVQHVAAGNGASGLSTGGAGGSITQIHVGAPGEADADIGARSGLAYGYAIGTAGGIFAGVGGAGAKSSGTAGDVTDITAAAISSIAAGKAATPHLAGTVDQIDLEGLTATAADGSGAFTNFGTANLVGSVIDPTAAGASTYKTGDGLIAAAVLTNNRNFIPEAELTLGPAGKLELVDYRQPSPVPVVTPVG